MNAETMTGGMNRSENRHVKPACARVNALKTIAHNKWANRLNICRPHTASFILPEMEHKVNIYSFFFTKTFVIDQSAFPHSTSVGVLWRFAATFR